MVKRHTSLNVCSVESEPKNEYAEFSNEEHPETLTNFLLLNYGGKFASWICEMMKSYCIAGIDSTISDFVGGKSDKLKSEYVLIMYAMLEYGFPIPLEEYIVKLCLFFDSCPIQHSTQVVLVFKRLKILEKSIHCAV